MRNGTVTGLNLLTTGTTTSRLVVNYSGVTTAGAFYSGPQVAVAVNTVGNTTVTLPGIPANAATVRIVAGDPGTTSQTTVIELHRDAGDLTFSYVGSMSSVQ